jgi:hypothetical protein
MKSTLLFFFALTLTLSSYGQINESAYSKMLNASLVVDQFFELYGISIEDLKNITGSPYEENYFQPGFIYSNNELTASNIPMRYNIFADEIEINTSQDPNQQNINVLSKSPDIFVKIGADIFVYVENLSAQGQSGYFKVVHEGEHFDLYKKSRVNYVEKRFAETSYQQDQPARFDRTDTFYLVSNRGVFYELPNNRRRFAAVFKEHHKEIDSYVRSNRLDIRNENDLKKIVKYFNEIL